MLPSIHRRDLLLGTAALAVGAVSGCSRDPEPETKSVAARRDVPLRLLLAGSSQDQEAILRGWGSVTDQPLSIERIELDRANATALAAKVMAAASKSDVLIYPLAFVADLDGTDSITPLSDQEFKLIEEESGNLYSALRGGVARYSDKYVGLPLGAALPALLSATELPEDWGEKPTTWQHYDNLVQQHWDGAAGEPSAPGWAGAMFLWRAATSTSWLFHRENFEALIDTEPYVQSLQQMLETHSKYQAQQQTPQQIWSAVNSGQLQGGIGFPQIRSNAGGEQLLIGDLPGVDKLSKLLLDPFSPVVSLSVNCRQSASAKRFIQWIGGGEGSSAVRQQVEGMTEVRTKFGAATLEHPDTAGLTGTGSVDQGLSNAGSAHYDQWLAGRLASPVTLPTLQIRQGGYYYAVLDQQVSRVLAGKATPAAALAEAASLWDAKTKEIEVDKQLRAWRRAQGMRG